MVGIHSAYSHPVTSLCTNLDFSVFLCDFCGRCLFYIFFVFLFFSVCLSLQMLWQRSFQIFEPSSEDVDN